MKRKIYEIALCGWILIWGVVGFCLLDAALDLARPGVSPW